MTVDQPQMSGSTPPAPLTPAEERQWAVIAHLSVWLNLFTGFLGAIAPLVVYMIYKERSRYVAYQSLQALIFQLIWWVGGGILTGIAWSITGVLSTVLIGILCIPFACIVSAMPLVALIYGTIGGVQANQGQDFKYWLVGDWVRSTLTG
jgi:uncharacterized Tic20 family protein